MDDEFLSRTALESSIYDELKRRVFEPTCVKFTMVRHQGLGPKKESLKPVMLRGNTVMQYETFDGKKVSVQNYPLGEAAEGALCAILSATGAREYHLTSTDGDLHIRITHKGRMLVSRSKGKATTQEVATPQTHDRIKNLPLSRFDASSLLRVLGLADKSGNPLPSAAGKIDQINGFLREFDTLISESIIEKDAPLTILDCGCGRAYLTLSIHEYLAHHYGIDVRIIGVDRNADLMQKANEMATALDIAQTMRFDTADLSTYTPPHPIDIVVALHACDTATDMAIAIAVRTRARAMLIAPCCQHDLQTQLSSLGAMRAVMRHGILRERLADILTDAFRAAALRILGFRVRAYEFVSQEASSRNIMLRAVFGVKKGIGEATAEYLALKEMWHVTPVIEQLLTPELAPFIGER